MKPGLVAEALALALPVLVAIPTRAADPKLIHRAIERGTAALRALQSEDGTWATSSHTAGMTSLAALTLLECGARPEDPAVRKAADAVRQAAAYLNDTYSLALAILLLDRLEDPAD